jgi:hypothetical protein
MTAQPTTTGAKKPSPGAAGTKPSPGRAGAMTSSNGARANALSDREVARGLSIPAPKIRWERVLREARNELADKYSADRKEAEATIEEYGLTIEISRLREKLARMATTDLQKVLLSTPGVPESLLNEAIKTQLQSEKEEDDSEKKQVEAEEKNTRKVTDAIAALAKKVDQTDLIKRIDKLIEVIERREESNTNTQDKAGGVE